MCYTRRKIEGDVVALHESDDTNFLKPNGQSRNLNVYGEKYNYPQWQTKYTGYCKKLASTSDNQMEAGQVLGDIDF